MTYEEIKAKFADRIEKDKGDSFQSVCPGHDDGHASLTVTKGDHGATLVYCHAGCDISRILSPVGLSPQDLFSNGSTPNPKTDPVVARYDYHGAGGMVVFRVERRQSKKFAQCQPDPDKPGKWIYNLTGVNRVLYHLPALAAAPPDLWVLLCEGEKDVENLCSAGYVATTGSGGAGKWQASYSETLRGRRVCILPDNDDPGRNHALTVGAQLAAQAADLRVLELPDLPPKGDVSDWLAAGNAPAKLAELVELAPTFASWSAGQAIATVEPVVEAEPIHCTDLGNARRLVKQFGPDLHYVYVWGKWFIWDGSRWAEDETGGIERIAKRTVASIYVEAGQAITDDERKNLARWALASEGQAKISAMIALARSELGISVKHSDLDGNAMLLNCRNGTIDLRTGKLLPHDRSYLATKQVAIDYDPAATCPLWEGFLKRIMADNPALIDFLQRAVGYSLTASVVEQCLFFLYGTGSNGKSTFTETIQALLGDYGQRAPTEMIMLKQNTAIPNDIARLPGARFVVTAEIEAGRRLAESLVKDLTGGDRMVARFMRQEYFEFIPTHKLWVYGNHKPIVKGSDNGIWRRINLVPFTVQIPEAEKDEQLKEKLKAELPGILAWAVRGCLDWQRTGLKPPAEVKAATAAYRAESDALSSFIDECCIEGVNCEVRFDALYTTYKNWCERNGERAERSKQFGSALTERGFEQRRGTGGARLRVGIGLIAGINDATDETEEPAARTGWISMEI